MCTTPVSLTVTNTTSTSVTLSWTAVNSNDPNVVINGYQFRYAPVVNNTPTNYVNVNGLNSPVLNAPFTITGLSPDTNYQFEVRTICQVNQNTENSDYGTATVQVRTLVSCQTPTGVTLSNPTDQSIIVNFTPSAGVTSAAANPATNSSAGYTIRYKKASDVVYTEVPLNAMSNPMSAPNPVYLIQGLEASTTYNVSVAARCGAGNTSPFSTDQSLATLAACNSPVINNAFNITSTSAILDWINTNPSSSIFDIEYRMSSMQTWTLIPNFTATNSAQTQYEINGLVPDTTYIYRVKAKCANNLISGWSATSQFTTNPPVENIDADLFIANPISTTEAYFNWNSLVNVAGYILQLRSEGSSGWEVSIPESGYSNQSAAYTDVLSPGESYEARVITIGSDGVSQSTGSEVIDFTMPVDCVPPPVTSIAISNIDDTTFIISWDKIAESFYYTVEVADTEFCTGFTDATYTAPFPITYPSGDVDFGAHLHPYNSYEVTGLTASTTYYVRVRSECDGDIGNLPSDFNILSTAVCATAPANSTQATYAPCAAPTLVATPVTDISPISAKISWNGLATTAPAFGVLAYAVYYRKATGISPWMKVDTVSAPAALGVMEYVVTGLEPNNSYFIGVSLVCEDNPYYESARVVTASFDTPNTNCWAPTTVNVTNIQANSVMVGWTAVPTATEYNIEIELNASGTWASYGPFTGTSTTITGLLPNTNYALRMKSFCNGGTEVSTYSTVSNFTTTAVPCGLVNTATIVHTNPGAVAGKNKFDWAPVPGATSYDVQICTDPAFTTPAATPCTPAVTVYGSDITQTLTTGTNYYLRITATCNTVVGSPSATYSFVAV